MVIQPEPVSWDLLQGRELAMRGTDARQKPTRPVLEQEHPLQTEATPS